MRCTSIITILHLSEHVLQWNGARQSLGHKQLLIGIHIWAFNWYKSQLEWPLIVKVATPVHLKCQPTTPESGGMDLLSAVLRWHSNSSLGVQWCACVIMMTSCCLQLCISKQFDPIQTYGNAHSFNMNAHSPFSVAKWTLAGYLATKSLQATQRHACQRRTISCRTQLQ